MSATIKDVCFILDMINGIKTENCVGNAEDAIIASKYPIDRIELNSVLELGGLTPSLETLKAIKVNCNTSVCSMVRPRGGDFIYKIGQQK